MTLRPIHFFFVLLFSLKAISFSQEHPGHPVELVESIPVETVLDNPEIRNTPEVWLEMITGAKQSLDIEQFYISHEANEPLEEILDAIIAAGTRGVKVRIIIDSRMYRTYPQPADSLGTYENIAVRVIDFRKFGGGIQHAKFFIVDGNEIFLGSQNFDWRALKHIHELGIRIKSEDATRMYRDIFELDWKVADKAVASDIANSLTHRAYPHLFTFSQGADTLVLTPTASPGGFIPDTTLWDEPHIAALIDSAKSDVCLQFLAYSPVGRDKSFYPVLDNAMRRAAIRGVKVKLLVSDWAKESPEVEHLKSLSVVPNIEVKFTAIPEWSGGYVPFARVEHCKFIVADGVRFWLGTSNGEKSYFHTSRNLGVVIESRRLGEMLQRVFMKSWDGPYGESVKAGVTYTPREHGERK